MKKKLFINIAFLAFASIGFSQDWTWMKGSNLVNQAGTFGTQGISAPANTPGARFRCSSWTDASGNFWLFGGSGGFLNDLWRYNPGTNQWAWMKGTNLGNQNGIYGTQGVSAPANNPGGRFGAMSWIDASGNFWLFGGFGYSAGGGAGHLNDLWKYNPGTNQWTWMKGPNSINQYGVYGTQGVAAPTNYPGGRKHGVSWIDASGFLWLFSGDGYAAGTSGYMNDLWRYNPSTNEWTWIKGSNLTAQAPVYGTQGVAAPTNNPGSREEGVAWNLSGIFYFFGGTGFRNDLWSYDPVTNNWTWVKGSNLVNQNGTYGTQGVFAPANNPGARRTGIAWKDPAGYLWLFGGQGYPAAGSSGDLNDLWKYNPGTNEWAWFKGSNLFNQNGTYGTQGISAPANNPGARVTANACWVEPSGNLWLFGGGGRDGVGSLGTLNDVWKYGNCIIPSTPGTINGLTSMCTGAGTTTYSVASVGGATSYTWSLPGGWSGSSATNTISATPGSSGIFTVTASNACGTSAQQTLNITVNALPTISVNSGSICSGNSFTMVASGANTYTFQGGNAVVSPIVNTSYTVIGTSTAGCVSSNTATSNVTVNATPTISLVGGAICPGGSFTLNPSGANTYSYSGGSQIVSPSVTTSYSVSGTSTAGCVSNGSAVATVTVSNTLTVTIAGTNTICFGSLINLTAGGATSYTWNTGATTTTITPTPTANITYSVIGASGSCSNTAMLSVTVNPPPALTITSGNSSAFCSGETTTLTATGANTYTWNTAATTNSILISPTVTTNYTVTGTGTNGCSNTTTITQIVNDCTGLVTITSIKADQFSVYPNPTFSTVILTKEGSVTGKIEMYNCLGSLLFSSEIKDSKTEIDLTKQPNGIYFIRIGTFTKKIIKE